MSAMLEEDKVHSGFLFMFWVVVAVVHVLRMCRFLLTRANKHVTAAEKRCIGRTDGQTNPPKQVRISTQKQLENCGMILLKITISFKTSVTVQLQWALRATFEFTACVLLRSFFFLAKLSHYGKIFWQLTSCATRRDRNKTRTTFLEQSPYRVRSKYTL